MSPNRSKRLGDQYEREAVALLTDLTGWNIQRCRHAGRPDDIGDLLGLPDCCVQVKGYPSDPQRAIRDCINELPQQQANSGYTFGFGMIRLPRRRFIAVATVEQQVALLREATRL